MDLKLAGRVAVVAGSSRGIGLGIAESLLSEGCRTVISGRSPERLAASRDTLAARFGSDHILAFSGDLTTRETIREFVRFVQQHWGTIDIVVANIGVGSGVRGVSADDAEWSRLLTMNLLAPTRLVSEFLPVLLESRNGAVVLIGSITGLEATPAPLAYSAAKAALLNYTKNLAREVGGNGVRVNYVAPGNVLFDGGSWDRRLRDAPEETSRFVRDEVPLRRFGKVDEIASVVTFLASDRASFLTGACVVVDGGQTRGL